MAGAETIHGYSAPIATQFSIFLDNKVGKMLELLDVFDGRKFRLVALSVMDSADHAVLRIVTTDSDLASRVLKTNQLPFSQCDILVVEISHEHTLNKLCKSLLAAELNIHYTYPLMVRPHGTPTIALHCDDMYLAAQILRNKQFTLLGEKDLLVEGADENPFDQPPDSPPDLPDPPDSPNSTPDFPNN